MATISLCMIVKNEEKVLSRCLDSVKGIADEYIIVDTGSTDGTVEIIKKYTSKVHTFKWIDDFSAARNYSFSQATMDYIFWLDADDVVKDSDRLKLLELKQHLNDSMDVVLMKYDLYSPQTGQLVCSFPRERLLKRSLNFIWHDPVHEYLELRGNIINVDISITHKSVHGASSRNLDILQKMVNEGKELSQRNKFYFARELFFNGRYEEAQKYYLNFLDSEGALISNYIDACLDLSYCYKLQGNEKMQLKALLKSFEYDSPRAEVCCKIAMLYKEKSDFKKAIVWYEVAANLQMPAANTTSIVADYWGYIPCMELSWLYWKTGNLKKAIEYNNRAGWFKPDSPTYLTNNKILEELLRP